MTTKSIAILGRQPAIGRAELESLYGSEHVQVVHDYAAVLGLESSQVAFARLGSTIKLGTVIGEVPSIDWRDIQRELPRLVRTLAADLSEGKVQLGVSVYGYRSTSAQLTATGLELKKHLKKAGYSVRLTPNKEPQLSSAQVLHNHLTGERGLELLIVRHDKHTLIARTTNVQDITAYAQRDQGRPKRDAFVGMLPPKLAQTIVNLASGTLAAASDQVVLDPFCGTGVVLQEALLMGYGAYGTDLEPRMIDYSRANLEWLATHGVQTDPVLEVGDATTHQWKHPFSVVAGETYLGRPLSAWPEPPKLQEIIGTCNVIIEKFLRNIGAQLKAGTHLCLAVPAWKAPNGRLHHLSVLDHLSDIGYNRVSFAGARPEELVYYRPDQIVARELLVITRK